jgi:hypothetical protein
MKLLLASLLVFLPLTVHAEYLGNLSANEYDPNSTPINTARAIPTSNSVTNQFGSTATYSNQSALTRMPPTPHGR